MLGHRNNVQLLYFTFARYFVVKGNIRIQRNEKKIALVTPNHFIGEMSFLNFFLDDVDVDIFDKSSHAMAATADAIVDDEEAVAYVWEFEELKEYLHHEREVRNALSAYMNHDLRAKLASLNHQSSVEAEVPEKSSATQTYLDKDDKKAGSLRGPVEIIAKFSRD
jgi:CRP-like cAMP-binding protein